MRAYERLLKYIQFETASDEQSETCPSTASQLVLGRALVREMTEMGVSDAHIDADGYVYGTIPANTSGRDAIGMIAHMDTVDSVPAGPMRARIVENYDGGDVVLESGDLLRPTDFPELARRKGRGCRIFLQHLPDFRREDALAGRDLADAVQQFVVGDALEENAVRAVLEGACEVAGRAERGQNQDARLGRARPDLGCRRRAVNLRHHQVKKHDVRPEPFGRGDGLPAVLRVADDFHARRRAEERDESGADDGVVVRDQQSDVLHIGSLSQSVSSEATSRRMTARVPLPGALSTCSSPP